MLRVTTVAKVWYSCDLEGQQEEDVKEYAKMNDVSLEDAVWELYSKGDLELYENSTESDFNTQEIECVTEEEDY